eukprot:SAG11_NODE_15_length_26319_cov_13.810564_20_plen_71_part_00
MEPVLVLGCTIYSSDGTAPSTGLCTTHKDLSNRYDGGHMRHIAGPDQPGQSSIHMAVEVFESTTLRSHIN